MATLEADRELYRQELDLVQEEIAHFELEEPALVNVVRKRKEIDHELKAAL